jgi:hypothetical protein
VLDLRCQLQPADVSSTSARRIASGTGMCAIGRAPPVLLHLRKDIADEDRSGGSSRPERHENFPKLSIRDVTCDVQRVQWRMSIALIAGCNSARVPSW